jgi:SOS-response transcriptional repressor LexA
MDKNNILVSQLARAVNVPQPTLYRLLKGKTSDIKLSKLIEITEYFSISLADLAKSSFSHVDGIKNANPYQAIPMLSWKEVNNVNSECEAQNSYFYPSVKCSERAFALKSKSSFEKIFSKETVFVVDPQVGVVDGDYVIVCYKNALEATIRRLILDGPIAELQKIHCHENELLTEETTIIGPILQSIVTHRNDLAK